MRVVIKKSADQADGHNVPIASRYSFQISASLPPKKPKGILRRRKPSNILASNRYVASLGGARPVPVQVPLNTSLTWSNEYYQKLFRQADYVDTEQWIEAVDSSGTTYYQQDASYFAESTVEEMPQHDAVDDSITTYLCSTCNYDSTDFNDFSAHECTMVDAPENTNLETLPAASGNKPEPNNDEKRVRKVEPIERAIAEILMNIESSCYDNAAQQGGENSEGRVYEGSQQEDGDDADVVMEYVENPPEGEEEKSEYKLESYSADTSQQYQEEGTESAPIQFYVSDVPDVSETATVGEATPQIKEFYKRRQNSFPRPSPDTQNVIITLHPQTYGDVKHEFRCEQCSSQYAHMNGYALHMYKVHRVKVHYEFMCDNCNMLFNSFRFLTEHVTDGACAGIKTVSRYQPCDRCPMKFRTIDVLRSHMVSVHNVDCLWHCDECSIEFSSQRNFESHDCGSFWSKKRKQEFKCQFCLKLLSSKKSLNGHYKTVHGREALLSPRRTGVTPKKGDRFVGKENKSGVSYYVLPEPIPAPSTGEAPTESKAEKCGTCEMSFETKEDLLQHEEEEHDSDSGDFECAFCGDEFDSRAEMRMHIDFEHGFKTYPPAKQAASRVSKIGNPVLPPEMMAELRKIVFGNPKKKTCDICAVVVKANVDLLDHVLKHNQEDIQGIIDHHKQASKTSCKFCGRSFQGKVVPHACRKVKCQYCRGWFAGEQFLAKHIKALHPTTSEPSLLNAEASEEASRQELMSLPPLEDEVADFAEDQTTEMPASTPQITASEALPSVQVHEVPEEILQTEYEKEGEVVAGVTANVPQEDVEFKMAALFNDYEDEEQGESVSAKPESRDQLGVLEGGLEPGEILGVGGKGVSGQENEENQMHSRDNQSEREDGCAVESGDAGLQQEGVDPGSEGMAPMNEEGLMEEVPQSADTPPDNGEAEGQLILPEADKMDKLELGDVINDCGINEEEDQSALMQKIVYVTESGEIIPESQIQFLTDPSQVEPGTELYENQTGYVEYTEPGENQEGIRYILADGETAEYSQEGVQYIEGLENVEPGTAVYLVDNSEHANYQCRFCGVGFELEDMWAKHEEMHQLIDGALEEDPEPEMV